MNEFSKIALKREREHGFLFTVIRYFYFLNSVIRA